MRTIVLIFTFFAFSVSGIAQNNIQAEKRTFKNQGEQENYWAENFFKEKYISQNYPRFNGKVCEIDKNTFKYDTEILVIDNLDLKWKSIFLKGILYPQIIGTNISFIGNFEELEFLRVSPKIRRFRFWLYTKMMMNPTVYLLEITNDHATEETGIEFFIENGKLTFLKSGWLIL
jgi:hypothetical protein